MVGILVQAQPQFATVVTGHPKVIRTSVGDGDKTSQARAVVVRPVDGGLEPRKLITQAGMVRVVGTAGQVADCRSTNASPDLTQNRASRGDEFQFRQLDARRVISRRYPRKAMTLSIS